VWKLLTRVFLALTAAFAFWAYLAAGGYFGKRQEAGDVVVQARDPVFVAAKQQRQALAQSSLDASRPPPEKQILFGDLHAHTTYSFDAYNISLPMYQGEGAHPPADACDFARYCSGLDFWSINDHAEGLTPRQWAQTRDMVRQCNAVAGDPEHPDMVTFLGWEWTQIGDTPETHYGHKNVVLRDTAEGSVPLRPISSRQQLFPGGGNPYGMLMRLLLIAGATDGPSRQRYYDFARFLQDRDDLQPCEKAETPSELFGKLDDWAFPYLVIPHGNSWGFYTPPLSSWDKQLAAHSRSDTNPLSRCFRGTAISSSIAPGARWRLTSEGRPIAHRPPWISCRSAGRPVKSFAGAAWLRVNLRMSANAGRWLPGPISSSPKTRDTGPYRAAGWRTGWTQGNVATAICPPTITGPPVLYSTDWQSGTLVMTAARRNAFAGAYSALPTCIPGVPEQVTRKPCADG
jgi:hypothetical protein